jgi:hypothetical protein
MFLSIMCEFHRISSKFELLNAFEWQSKKSPHFYSSSKEDHYIWMFHSIAYTMAREKLNLFYQRISKWNPPRKNISNNNSNSLRVPSFSLSLAPFPLGPDVKLNPGHSRSAYSAAHAAEGVSLLALTAPKIRIVSENKESAEHLHGNDGAQREREAWTQTEEKLQNVCNSIQNTSQPQFYLTGLVRNL